VPFFAIARNDDGSACVPEQSAYYSEQRVRSLDVIHLLSVFMAFMLSALPQDSYLFFKKKVVGPATSMSRSINSLFFFWQQKKQNCRLAIFLLKSVVWTGQCNPKNRPCRWMSRTEIQWLAFDKA
jgi:hypothetical protein